MNGWKGIVLALALLLWPCCALGMTGNDVTTPRVGVAVTAPQGIYETVPMYAEADEQSDIRMRYYSGVRVRVTELLSGGLVAVTVGMDQANVSGYMRASDLRYGALAIRKVPRCVAEIVTASDVKVYTAPRQGAAELFTQEAGHELSAIGIGADQWVQLAPGMYEDEIMLLGAYTSDGETSGFANIPALGTERQMRVLTHYFVPPCEEELDFEQAYARAIEIVLDGGYDPNGSLMRLPSVYSTEQGLRGLRAQIALWYESRSGEANWGVIFENETESLQVFFSPDGEEVYSISPGNG